MYSKVFLRLEPLGLELVAESARRAGHDVRLIDLQVARPSDYVRWLDEWQPDAVAFSGNYLANIPEIIDLAKVTNQKLPEAFVFVGGHSASFVAREILGHGQGAIDAVLKGEGEAAVPTLLLALENGRRNVGLVPGAVTADGEGPPPRFVSSLDDIQPARDLLPHRRKYFIGVLDPCASIELTRGCPWDCSFCSAWTFYGRSYRQATPEKVVEDLARIREPGVFIVDDVAFIQPRHAFDIGREIERRNIRKRYYLETRADVLLRNKDAFRYWTRLGLEYMFLGLEAIDEEGLKKFRKRVSLGRSFEALEFARSLGIGVAINIIAEPDWDERQFDIVRDWALSVPEMVHLTVNTPYPGTETWITDSRKLTSRDYRLFDIQHAVLPTKLPLPEFYRELVKTQQVLSRKYLGWTALKSVVGLATRLLLKGQTNFVKMLWKFDGVYNAEILAQDHRKPVKYELILPRPEGGVPPGRSSIYVHAPETRTRKLDQETESFVSETRSPPRSS